MLDLFTSARHEAFTGSALRYPTAALAAAWKMLLFGDGSPTRLISLLSGVPLVVSVLGMDALPDGDASVACWAPLALPAATIAQPRVLRRVWLESPTGQRYGYACSWWCQADVPGFLPNLGSPIGDALASHRHEIHRELLCVVHAVGHAGLEEGFGLPPAAAADVAALQPGRDWGAGELWGRWYIMRHQGKPLCVIYEVFSPRLEELLGCRVPA